jgi:hypothetical protein
MLNVGCLKTEKVHTYRAIPYFLLFIPLLASPFLDKSVYSMSLLLPWTLALFVYPPLSAEQERASNYSQVLKANSLGAKTEVPLVHKRNWLEYSWLALLPLLFLLIIAGVDFQMTYSLIAILGLAIATVDSYPAFVESKTK